MTYAEIRARAVVMGITALEDKDLAGYEAFSDGCSGGLSRIYTLAGREISCHRCCVVHDWLYEWGGTSADRKRADKLLRWCAAGSGSFEGWTGPARRAWRWFRAWVMYAAVRAWGWRGDCWTGA